MIPEALKKHQSEKTQSLKRVILFTFYKKPMANKNSNRVNSAMPESMKVATTTNEIQRRMRNTSRDLPHQVLDQVLKNYMDE